MAIDTPAFQGIGRADDVWFKDALRAAPAYGAKVASAIRRTIRCIHGLEKLHKTVSRDALEVYLGRATETTLAQRWRHHFEERGHNYGAILFRCDTDRVEALEDVAIKILRKLHDRDALCVGTANKWPGNVGRPPRLSEYALIYMTWTIVGPVEWSKPSSNDIQEIASEVVEETDREFSAKQVETGLTSLKRLTEYDRLYWWKP
jgi:hypothetical protein